MKNVTHIFFDLDNTLWDAIGNKSAALREIYHHFSLDAELPFEELERSFDHINHNFHQQVQIGNLAQISRFIDLANCAPSLKQIDPENISREFNKSLNTQNQLLPFAEEVLNYLNEKYTLGLIINGTKKSAANKLKRTEIGHFFQTIHSGPDLKCPKPSTELYKAALKENNVHPSAAVMIGDHFGKDLSGALEIKMNVVLYHRWGGNVECPKINSLLDLKSLF